MGMDGFAERTRRELLATGATVRQRTADATEQLTEQEALIARLAQDGLSNPQIGATLYWDSQVPPCNYIVNNSSSSLAALASMGSEAFMQGSAAG